MKTTNRLLLTTTALVLLTFAGTACSMHDKTNTTSTSNAAQTSQVDTKTATFVRKATVGGMFEVQASELALNNSENRHIKHLAQMMVDDHSKANDKLASILASKNESNLAPAGLDQKHQDKLDALSNSDNFDADYLADMKEGHAKTIALFKDYAENGQDSDLRAFAKNTLPTLYKHKKHVDAVKL